MNAEVTEHRELGVVKWFGGFNSKTNRENDFGFIESICGEDIFVHKSALIDGETLLEGAKVSFFVTQSSKGLQAKKVRNFSLENEEIRDFVSVLKRVDDDYRKAIYLGYRKDLEQFYYSSSEEIKSKIAESLFEDDSGKALIADFSVKLGVYRQVLLSMDFSDFLAQGPDLDSLPIELIAENEEAVCQLICEGTIASVSTGFLASATLPILYACGLAGLMDEQTVQSREGELRVYLSDKFVYPDGENATLYKEIFAACIERIGSYKASPVIWSMLSEFLLKKYLYDRSFEKAAQLFNSNSGLERKIDCFMLYNLIQLLTSDNG